MRLTYFLEDAYDKLWNARETNISKYDSSDEWLADFFGEQEYMRESTIDLSLPKLRFTSRLLTSEKTEEDIANVKLLYGSLQKLSPLQASNPYLWGCLTHTVYRPYTVHRWLDDKKYVQADIKKKLTRIERRFFVTNRERSINATSQERANHRALHHNAISRLWWYGYMSYDSKDSNNPFRLTEILVQNTKVCSDFMNTPCCWNRIVGKGILRAVDDISKSHIKGGMAGAFRALKKYLNRYSAVSSLDYLSEDEVYSLCMEFFKTLRKDDLNIDGNESELDEEE